MLRCSLFFLLTFAAVRSEICLVCNCGFINSKNLEPKPGDSLGVNIEPYIINATYGSLKKYFYVDCSSDANVGQMNNLNWPDLQVLGIFGNFYNSKWKNIETFPENVKKQLTSLSLSSNQITEIEDSDLNDFDSLKKLNLTQNQVESVKRGTFARLGQLKILDLSGNWISRVDDWAFYGTDLKYLNLSRNSIDQLTPDVFRGLNNLTLLDLSENKLTKLSDEFGSFLPSLSFLYAKRNEFETFPELPKTLKEFDVSENRLTDLFLHHNTLELLNVCHNQLKNLDQTNLPNLRELRASHNSMTQLSDLHSNRIAILDLSYNKFNKIPEIMTSDKLPFLVEVFFDGNPISNITFPQQSEPFSDLSVVSLSHLKSVKKITKYSFQGIFTKYIRDCSKERGVVLNLSHNSIKFVDKDSFQSFSLCSIDLSYNQLRSLSENLLPWRKMSYINLQNNPWQCDCNLQWMLDDFLFFMYHNHPRLLFNLRCDTPLRYQNRMFAFWYNKSDQVFCNSGPSSFYLNLIGGKRVEIWTASAITCVVLGCIIIITAIVIIVLVCTNPSRGKRKRARSKKGPPYYKQIKTNLDKDEKSNENYV